MENNGFALPRCGFRLLFFVPQPFLKTPAEDSAVLGRVVRPDGAQFAVAGKQVWPSALRTAQKPISWTVDVPGPPEAGQVLLSEF